MPKGANIVFRYRPLWYVPKHYVTSFQLNMYFTSAQSSMTIDDILGDDGAIEMELNADRLILTEGPTQLAKLKIAGKQALLSVPIHSRSLTERASRTKLLAMLDPAPVSLRKRLVIHVVGLAKDDLRGLPGAVEILNSRVRTVTLDVLLDRPPAAPILKAKVHAIGGDLRDANWKESQIVSKLPEFVARATAAGLRTSLVGINTKSAALAAIYAGIDYVGGDAVIPECGLLDNIKPFRPIDLYTNNESLS
jgi:hypothetical protein